jgi:hypothetical protein
MDTTDSLERCDGPAVEWPDWVRERILGENFSAETSATDMPTRFVLTFTPNGRPGYRVGDFPTEERARDAAERHGAPPRGATPRPPLQWMPAPSFGAIMAVTVGGSFVVSPA